MISSWWLAKVENETNKLRFSRLKVIKKFVRLFELWQAAIVDLRLTAARFDWSKFNFIRQTHRGTFLEA